MRVHQFLKDFTLWASSQSDIQAVALVGSYARGTPMDSSDVDIVIITKRPDRYLYGSEWAKRFGKIRELQIEDYGKVTSVRTWYADGLEVEYGITDEDWSSLPLEEGTRQVIQDGIVELFDRNDILALAIENCSNYLGNLNTVYKNRRERKMMTEKYIQFEQHEDIGVIKLSRGVINAIDTILLQQLSEVLENARSNPDVRGLVLSSSNNKFFSIGFDIPYLYNLPETEFLSFFHTFTLLCLSLYTFPKPTVAAITGHATAGGCILALCCDRRIIAEGRRLIGLNEIKLGVPVPFIAECILRQIINGRMVRDILESGGFYAPDEALRIGLVDDARPLERLVSTAIEKTRQLALNSPSAFAAIKLSRTVDVEEKVRAKLKEREQIFIKNWFSPEARQLLKEAITKF